MSGNNKSGIKLKRAYEEPVDEDGTRLLVERLWPRGIRKDEAKIDRWFKELAPSPDLRKWYGHDPERWAEFRERYEAELERAPEEEMEALVELCAVQRVTFVFAARDEARNSAVVLRDYVLKKLQAS